MRNKTKRWLISCHSDSELTEFLQRNAEDGLYLKKTKGNKLFFSHQKYTGKRICAFTYFQDDIDTPITEEIRKRLPFLRKEGWDLISIGGAETIADSRRHIYLYEEKPALSIPEAGKEEKRLAGKRKIKKIISNLMLCAMYAIATNILLSNDLIRIVSNNAYLFFFMVFSFLLLISIGLSFASLVDYLRKKRKKKPNRILEHATYMTFFMLLFLCIFLIFDTLYSRNNSSNGTLTEIGKSEIRLYSDNLPISLEDLGLSAKGAFRTSRAIESESFLSSYRYFFDQSFGGDDGFSNFIGYTIFKSGNGSIRKIIEKQLFNQDSIADSELQARIGVDEVRKSKDKTEIFIKNGDSIMLIRSTEVLSDDSVKILAYLID